PGRHAPQFKQETLIKVIVLGLLTVFSFIGNSATVFSIQKRKKLLSRSTVHKLILHMAISDLFVTMACLLVETIWTYTVEWRAGDFLCKLIKYLQMFSLYASTFVLVLVGLDRLVAIRFPMHRAKSISYCDGA
ncbi:G protein-coupled receptor rhodopsin-like, partial [Trinorchestia longiramus]